MAHKFAHCSYSFSIQPYDYHLSLKERVTSNTACTAYKQTHSNASCPMEESAHTLHRLELLKVHTRAFVGTKNTP
jgi:hypothetical protein